MGTYLYDQAWERERQRLTALENLFDDTTRHRLDLLGVGEGWSCLEVGAGAGSTARWLAERVGATGQVVATDLDPRFLSDGPRLKVIAHDILTDEVDTEAYDLVHARALLEHLADRDRALSRMISAARPGGWVVIEDFHLGGSAGTMFADYFAPAAEVGLYHRVVAAFSAMFAAAGADLTFSPRLPSMLLAEGLRDVGATVFAPVVRGGADAPSFAELSLDFLSGRMIAAGLLTKDEIDRVMASLRDPGSLLTPMAMVTAWGRRP